MSDPILPWPVRHPALLDSAGAPVLLVAPDAAPADQPGILLGCPTERTQEPTPQRSTSAPIGYRLSAIGYCQRTAQIVTPSAPLRDLLARCLRTLDLAVADTPNTERGAQNAEAGTGTTTPTSADPIQRSAFSLQPSREPDLVLLDLAAPDALAQCQRLREQHPDLPIVALTPLVTEHLSAWEAGANAVLPIPFDVSDLQATIRILLGDAHD